jgi:hypothetical protein
MIPIRRKGRTTAPGSRKMRRSMMLALFAAALPLGAWGSDGMELRTKAIASAGVARPMDAPRIDGPFTGGRDPLNALIQIEAREHVAAPQAACEAASVSVCYNTSDGRIVYRGARQYMPKLQGMSADSVGLRHRRITFSYTFR